MVPEANRNPLADAPGSHDSPRATHLLLTRPRNVPDMSIAFLRARRLLTAPATALVASRPSPPLSLTTAALDSSRNPTSAVSRPSVSVVRPSAVLRVLRHRRARPRRPGLGRPPAPQVGLGLRGRYRTHLAARRDPRQARRLAPRHTGVGHPRGRPSPRPRHLAGVVGCVGVLRRRRDRGRPRGRRERDRHRVRRRAVVQGRRRVPGRARSSGCARPGCRQHVVGDTFAAPCTPGGGGDVVRRPVHRQRRVDTLKRPLSAAGGQGFLPRAMGGTSDG
ncbi:hypothetical protein MBT84_14890 [Streptomyces sp. MBT84]|nr:hypothetical protein [Streptomyces sp. MBT84]